MARPTDWAILDLDHDPTPGDSQHVKKIGDWLRDIAEGAERASRDVRSLAGDNAIMGWIGASGDAFRNHIGKFPSQLDKVATSHHLCADALIEFGNSLDACQSQADRALVQARPLHDQVQRLQTQLASAHGDLASAGKGVTAAQAAATVDPTSVQTAIRNQTTAQSAVDSLNSQLSGPAAQLEALKKLAASAESLRHTAEDTAKAKIHTAADAGIPPDSMWHKLGKLAGELWHGLVIVAEIVSAIGGLVLLVVGGPVWLIVGVVAAGVIVFADTAYKYHHGKASKWQLGMSILGCFPITKGLTSMAALGDAFRTGGFLGAGAHLAGAAGTAAKDTLAGMSGLLKGGLGKEAMVAADGMDPLGLPIAHDGNMPPSAAERLFPGLKDVNPNYHLGEEWQINCQSVVQAVDNLLKGEGSTAALPRPAAGWPMPFPDFVSRIADFKPFVPMRDYRSIGDALTEEGARGIVWGRTVMTDPTTGKVVETANHVFNVVRKNNTVFFLDGQVGGFANLYPYGELQFLRTH